MLRQGRGSGSAGQGGKTKRNFQVVDFLTVAIRKITFPWPRRQKCTMDTGEEENELGKGGGGWD